MAREYYNCPTARGVALENAGGAGTGGSHWDRAELGDEAMSGSDINEPRYSIFTIALMEDTGWYKVDMAGAGGDYHDEIIWG